MYTSDLSFADDDSEDDFVAVESDEDFDFEPENAVPAKKKSTSTKKATASKKKPATKKPAAKGGKKAAVAAAAAALADHSNYDDDDDMSMVDDSSSKVAAKAAGGKKGGRTIEEQYQKKTQLEHILLRPDTYIGSTEPTTQPMFVLNPSTGRIVNKTITYTPGLYKIFDEILVNAADNKQRDPNMDKLDVTIDAESNTISVKNNGQGIPVEIHKEQKCYVPTMIFGQLLTGSNFDDDEKKTTGGRNGYGAKLANIFSTKFVVECLDSSRGVKFSQTFRDNKGKEEEPIIKNCTAKEKKAGDYTKITFCPDLGRFNMMTLDSDTVALLSKRAYDIAGSMANRAGKRLIVTLNGTKIPVKSFETYLELFDDIKAPVAYEKVNDSWEIGVAPSDGSFQQVSFVNAISTSKGGGHVNYITDQVAANLKPFVKKKNKGTEIRPNQIKNHLCVFVNALVVNPAFDSQTKENLTTRKSSKDGFGSTCEPSAKFMKQVEKSDIVENILAMAKFKERQALKRTGGTKKAKVTGIAKLDDANFAGGAKSKDCTLILTEGDSAKSLAMSGLSVVGRDYYGVFPLKGKPLNVRDAKNSQIKSNEEIKNIVEIMGLKYDVEYDESNIKTLRYGHLMIMADQDHDGSHIKGLIINFIHHFWPSLLNHPGFLQQFITPIIKATKGKKSKTFFTLPEYDAWKESTGNDAKGWKIKYYKGLGTSTSAEAKEYFGNLDLHEIHFGKLDDDNQVEIGANDDDDDESMMEFDASESSATKVLSGGELIAMAFSKSQVEDRKVWLNGFVKDTYLNYSQAQKNGVRYSEFINKELILFSNADNARSIPHVMDGFKPSQRKILFACFKRKLKGEIKVAQLAGYVSEHSAYHHGEVSLQGTIVGMCQSFIGSNNINLLTPSGQFGTRRMGGKDAASARYIFTKLEKITRTIFHPDDDALLNYLNDDGLSIEPEYYMPVIPMVLVNGSDGIGTGWSSSTPNYCPRAIIANLRRRLKGEEMEKMYPHYYGFTGEIVAETNKRAGFFIASGKIERTNDTTLKITELPIKKWTQDYKMFLEGMMLGGSGASSSSKSAKSKKDEEKKEKESVIDIKDFKENHTDTTVSFTITATKERIDAFEKMKDGLIGKFKLKTSISTSNMQLFDDRGRIIKYDTPESIIEDFYRVRLEFYEKRKAHLLEILRVERLMLSNKARFVEEVCSGDLVVSNRKRSEILEDLQERGYDLMPNGADSKNAGGGDGNEDEETEDDNVDENASDADLAKGFEYLLGMKIWSLTYEKAEKLRAELEDKTQAVADLEATPPSTLWWNDLDAIEDALDERDDEIAAANAEERRAQTKNKKAQKKKAAKGKKKKKKADEWDSDESSDEDEPMMSDDDDDDFFTSKKKKTTSSNRAPVKKVREAPPAAAAAALPRYSPKPVSKTASKTAAAAKKPADTKKPKAEPVPEPESVQDNYDTDSDDDSDDDMSMDLATRLKSKAMISPVRPTKPPTNDRSICLLSEDEDEDEGDSLSSDGKRPSPKNTETTPSTKPKASKKAKKAKKEKKTDSDSDMSFAGGDSAEEDSPVAPREQRSRRGGAAAARKTYTFDDSDDSDSEYSFE